jgi:hypothetical protein
MKNRELTPALEPGQRVQARRVLPCPQEVGEIVVPGAHRRQAAEQQQSALSAQGRLGIQANTEVRPSILGLLKWFPGRGATVLAQLLKLADDGADALANCG